MLFNFSKSGSARRRNVFRHALFVVAALLAFNFPVHAQEEEETTDETTEAVKIFNQGQDAHEKGDLNAAVKFYEQALKIVPEFPEAEFQRGNAFLSLNKTSEAEKSFRRAIELREDWTLPMASLGAILVGKNEFAEAEKILTTAVKLDENNFPAYAALTDLRLKTRAQPAVLKELLAKLQILSSKAKPAVSVWVSKAMLERALGDRTAAKASISRALLIEPKNQSALTERAEIALLEGDLNQAAEWAKTIVQNAPDSADAKFLQARVFAAEGKLTDAQKILDSIKTTSAEIEAFKISLASNGQANIVELEKQIETDPKNAYALGRLCSLLRVENPPKALEYCRRANEAEPTNVNHAVGFGAALLQAKRYAEAAVILLRIKELAPDNFTARANLATAYFQLKRYAEAKTEYQWLTEKQPDLPIAYYFLAIAHDNLSEYLDAMANYQQFLKLADAASNKLEIEKVNLRLPSLQKQIKDKKGKR